MQDRASPRAPLDLSGRVLLAWPADRWRDVNVAVAVSGGADSVALFRALLAAKQATGGRGDLSVIHFDHAARLRSSEDAEWVEALAAHSGTKIRVERSANSGERSEDELRSERRAFYKRAANQLGARYVATAHTADDQAETVLFRAARGAGLRGLAGIRATARLDDACSLVRPLLGETRSAVLAYLAALDQPFLNDATNEDRRYARNWLRHDVLPLLESRVPGASASLAQLAAHAAEATAVVERLAARVADAAVLAPPTAERIELSVAVLEQEERLLQVEAVRACWRRAAWPERAMTAGDWRRVVATTEPTTLPGGVRAERLRDRLVLTRAGTRSC